MTRKVLLGLAIMLMAFAVYAQAMPPEHVEDFLNETDELIADAAPRFDGDAIPEPALDMYERSVEFQENAWDMFERSNLRGAYEKSSQARDLIQQALRLLDVPPPGTCDHPGLEELIENNYDLIDVLTPLIEDSGREELSDMLDGAIELNNDASEAFEDDNFAQANRFAQSARHTLEQIRRLLAGHGGGGGGIDSERIRTELERTDEVIAEVTEALGDDAPDWAVELLERANEAQATAWGNFEDANYREAITLTQRARNLALRARRPAGREAIADRVEAELDATDATITRVTPIVEESGDEDAIELLADAVELQAEARADFDESNYEDAMHKTNNARRMALRAAGMIDDFDATEIREAIAHTQTLIDEATPTITRSDNERAMELLERAIALQEEATEDFIAEEYRSALAKTTTARNLVRRALAMVTDEE